MCHMKGYEVFKQEFLGISRQENHVNEHITMSRILAILIRIAELFEWL